MHEHSRHWLILSVLALILFGSVAGWLALKRSEPELDPKLNETVRQVAALERQEEQADQTVWAKEKLAEECGQVFEEFWDRLNHSSNRWEVVSTFQSQAVVLPRLGPFAPSEHGILTAEQVGPGDKWTGTNVARFVSEKRKEGWQIDRVEFRHLQFDTDAQGRPDRSRYYASAHLTRPTMAERAILEGELQVRWGAPAGKEKRPSVRQIEFDRFQVRKRAGAPGFKEVLLENVPPPAGSYFIDPVIVYDLDGDGTPEIILAAKNLVYQRTSSSYVALPFCRHPPGLIFTGAVADFDGDGAADYLCAKFEGLFLYKGSPQGTFDEPARLVWRAQPHLRYAQALTCGDIDGDGDLDVWLGQYKVPYDRGQMPTPYYDANDGHPSYLLLNDGQGGFADGTASSGLSGKRWRRVYGASFADLNDDRNLDLIITSDFAGVELYLNQGNGRFQGVTDQYLPERHGFGMSHTLADLNGDAKLDLLMVGMNVPVAQRLAHSGAVRPGFERDAAMIGPMTFGNRLFIRQEDGRYQQTAFGDSIARTGWSWAGAPLDLDNDGYLDLYVANGHESKESVREYETEFWLHDIYVANSKDDLVPFAYFQAKSIRTRGAGMSYGGYEKNRLFLNREGKTFLEIGHLMGVGLEEDSRNVLAEDLDGDGRQDLIVTTFEVRPVVRQTLRIFSNVMPDANHWIGFQLREQGGGLSPVGARVTIQFGGRTATAQIVTGEGFRAQRSNVAHFGLGAATEVESARIEWRDGRVVLLEQPKVDQYHRVAAPAAK